MFYECASGICPSVSGSLFGLRAFKALLNSKVSGKARREAVVFRAARCSQSALTVCFIYAVNSLEQSLEPRTYVIARFSLIGKICLLKN
jgi:hypothetical protein